MGGQRVGLEEGLVEIGEESVPAVWGVESLVSADLLPSVLIESKQTHQAFNLAHVRIGPREEMFPKVGQGGDDRSRTAELDVLLGSEEELERIL
jgi:hypothetical protein